MQVIVFEDTKVLELRPLVNLKPVYGLSAGFRSLKEKLEHSTRGEVTLTWHLRRYLASFYAEQHPECVVNRLEEDDVLLVNGRIVFDESSSRVIVEDAFEPGRAYMQGDDLLFARVTASLLTDDGLLPDLIDTSALAGELITEEITGFRIIGHIWDMIAFHPDELLRDAETLELGRIEGDVHPSVAIVNRSNIYVGSGAVVRAGVVLDGDDGFVAIGSGAIVDPQAVLMQNVFLAPWSRVKIGAKIYSNVAVGTASKIGGEVEDSLITIIPSATSTEPLSILISRGR